MCLIILVDGARRQQGRSGVIEKYRCKYPRLASIILGRQDPPPQYDEATPPQNKIKPIAQRPDSLTLPVYQGYRRPRQATL
ncbi:hypothetical protein BGZ60DRAFT_403902 [Tricladium varicosporioides]|nr:hypothetical protein BGZ60DRAFT_403902 [Hymenoscyphus varicosporioides]